ncbi:Nuclear fusion protein KAR5 [Talaromyces islandicus]|uniref:Nuclear fusion protein KAR5 n=1 Tax=Talaromyces islandicus TaxID=28573 RepID=A0A0U1LN36_TALIS|nr:Nuclear fusion protein KAR5 [Talaromyces islandicus]
MRPSILFTHLYIFVLSASASFFDSYTTFIPKGKAKLEVQNESTNLQWALRRADSAQLIENLDLVDFIQSRALQHDRVFSNAIQLLESMKSSPSCSKIAATKLLTSCQSLSAPDDQRESEIVTALDHIKSIYAVRLALCELTGAGTPIPMACSPLHIATNKPNTATWNSQKGEASTSSTVLQNCLTTLESRPQWWTSYSNSRQNALVICQAARIEVEKDEMLNLHQSLVENMATMNKGLQDILRDASLEGAKHKAFVDAVRDLRAQTMSELQEDQSRARGTFANFARELEATVGSSISKILSFLKDAESDSAVLNEGLRDSTDGLSQLRSDIHDLYDNVELRNARFREVFERDVQDMESNHELTLAMRSSLNDIGQTVSGVDGALEWLAGRFVAIQQQESLLVERLRDFETHLERSNDQAKDLLQTQALQAEAIDTQARAQDALGASTRIAYAMVDKLTARATQLETALEETAARFDDMSTLNSVFGIRISAWSICSLLLSIIAVQNPRWVMPIFALAGLSLLYRASSNFIATIIP